MFIICLEKLVLELYRLSESKALFINYPAIIKKFAGRDIVLSVPVLFSIFLVYVFGSIPGSILVCRQMA